MMVLFMKREDETLRRKGDMIGSTMRDTLLDQCVFGKLLGSYHLMDNAWS